MVDLIAAAYGRASIGIVTTSQEAPRGTSPDNTKLMLQALLAYRVGRTRHS